MAKSKNLPKDTNLLAKMIVDIATGENEQDKVEDKKKIKKEASKKKGQ